MDQNNLTLDKFSKIRLRALYPGFGDAVQKFMEEVTRLTDRDLSVIEGMRSLKKQHRMFKSGDSSLDSRESPHNYGLACHLVFRGDDHMLKKYTDSERRKFFDGLKLIANQCGVYAMIDLQTHVIHLEMDICDLSQLADIHKEGGMMGQHDVWQYLDSLRKVPYGRGWLGDYKFYKCIELEGI